MAPVESRNVCTNTMFSAILAVLFAIKEIKFVLTKSNKQTSGCDVTAFFKGIFCAYSTVMLNS